jgi:hypothetical protein
MSAISDSFAHIRPETYQCRLNGVSFLAPKRNERRKEKYCFFPPKKYSGLKDKIMKINLVISHQLSWDTDSGV